MLSLLKNEWIKLWNKKQTWVFAGLIIAFTLCGALLISFVFSEDVVSEDGWDETLEMEIAEQKEILANEPDDEWEIEHAENIIEENEQLLEAGVNPNDENNMVFLNLSFLGLASFITLFSVIVASSIVSSEIDNNTMKHLLIRPYERWQILLSKFVTVLAFSITLIGLLLVSNLIFGTLFFGTGSFSSPAIEHTMEGIVTTTVNEVLPAKIGLYFLNMLMFVIISFAVSILFKSQTLAVGIGIFILFSSSILQGFMMLLEEYAWFKFIFLPHLSLPTYAVQDHILQDVGLGFSLTILAIYGAIFMTACLVYFQKRDLAD
ncbi:ABC transporter permease [Salipaludibacillus sp. LMS25]|jgi:ABC-2 type transport system permease protein|uniref:ABC transporter permease n=1 Tax=Salipaludibacillus sp. LMS25 TaxID=2924031 RepID=UPI0020D143AE|nr:ABC transporter permease [Salipaludibacillus sp. LMS25]UTR13733.1 ABC transporter permease [Salipaludibacillus sp. LMS25]